MTNQEQDILLEQIAKALEGAAVAIGKMKEEIDLIKKRLDDNNIRS